MENDLTERLEDIETDIRVLEGMFLSFITATAKPEPKIVEDALDHMERSATLGVYGPDLAVAIRLRHMADRIRGTISRNIG